MDGSRKVGRGSFHVQADRCHPPGNLSAQQVREQIGAGSREGWVLMSTLFIRPRNSDRGAPLLRVDQ